MTPLLTVLANLHREGHLAYAALRSAVLAVTAAARHGVCCRILAVIDCGDDATRAEVARFAGHVSGVHEVAFGNLSRARNHGFERIDTKYVATLDGDDLFDRDWLWRGVRFLEQHGDEQTVGHTEVRLSFGSERHGRLHIGSDSHLFHPLNLIASWHYAGDVIAPTALYRRLPLVPNDYASGLGGEDWLWTCESIVEGVKHVVIPKTTYFYRRRANFVSLGMLPGITFGPTRLLDKRMAESLDRAQPSAAIRFADRSDSRTGAAERWTGPPRWLERSVRRGCDVDLEVRDLYRTLRQIPFETPAFFPAVAHFYLELMALVRDGSESVVFFCDRLTEQGLATIEGFLASHRLHGAPGLDVVIVSLDPRDTGRDAHVRTEAAERIDDSGLRMRFVDLGGEAAFGRLWESTRHELIVRFLIQARPALAVNLDGDCFDRFVANFGRAARSGGTRTIRLCRDGLRDAGELDEAARIIDRAGDGYSRILCEGAAAADWLGRVLRGTQCRVRRCCRPATDGIGRAFGDALYDLAARAQSIPVAATDGPHRSGVSLPSRSRVDDRAPDVSCVMTARNEGYQLNLPVQAAGAMCADAARHGLGAELILVADRSGQETRAVLAALADACAQIRVIEIDRGDEAAARNAGIAAAAGRHVAVLSNADRVSPGWLARAVRAADEHGGNAIVHPELVVEFGARLRVTYQPDMRGPAIDLRTLALDETWTTHALAHRELFQRLGYRPSPEASGLGASTWQWNCDTVASGARHLVVSRSAIYRRSPGHAAEPTCSVGRTSAATLGPSRFFSEHAWLHGSRDSHSAARTPPVWHDAAYLHAYPDVARGVAVQQYPSGFAHYALRGRAEGREPFWRSQPQPWMVPAAAMALRARGALNRSHRSATEPVPAGWSESLYLDRNPDVVPPVETGRLLSGYAHYCFHGRAEGRDPAWQVPDAAAPARAAATRTGPPPYLPQWLDDEMRVLADDEPLLRPERAGAFALTAARLPAAADAYRACRAELAASRPTHIFIAPALRPGGSELSLLHHVEAVLTVKGNRPLIITTAAGDDSWRHRLPPGCAWIKLDSFAGGLDDEARIGLMVRLLINSEARCLHIFYSDLGWLMLRRHAAVLAARMRIFLSVFLVPRVETGFDSDYPRYLPALRAYLSGIFTDNARAACRLATVCGVPGERVVVVRHPVFAKARFAGPPSGSKLALWASRVDADKRPALLRQIARRLPDWTFHVYGAPVLEGGRELDRLKAVPNIAYLGPFTGFDSIASAPYGCFLYTSAWDGLPNVLLEAMKSGLLAVAPDVGAISEVVGDDTGLLVRRPDDPAAYAAALQKSHRDPETHRRVAEAGRRRIEGQFTTAGFLQSLQAAASYLTLDR